VIAAGSVLRRAPDVRHRLLRPEAVVIRQTVPEVLVLNDVAGELLDRIDGSTPVSGLVEQVAPLFDVDRPTLEADALLFLTELHETGIVEIVGS
jgi:Coenzyme PQQ synthesis protein D (PqqD)